MVELTEEDEMKLNNLIKEITDFMTEDKPPEINFKPKCKRCAYYEYCFI